MLLAAMSSVAQDQEQQADPGPQKGLLSGPGPTFVVPTNGVPRNWSVIAYGDMRFTDPANTSATNPVARRALVARIAAERPDAVLLSGDVPLDGMVANDYAVFHSETAAWRDAKLRVYPALGNHELRGDANKSILNWWATFPELNHRRWYSIEFGNAYFILVDSDLPLTEGSDQRKWLADQLDHLPNETQFVFLAMHHPPVADDGMIEVHKSRPNEASLRDFLELKQKTSQATIVVVAGHIHNYSRFLQGGVTFLISGGGGAKPYEINRTSSDLYRVKGFPNFHYIKFVYDGEKVTATMYRMADPKSEKSAFEPRDTFVLAPKTGAAGAAAKALPKK